MSLSCEERFVFEENERQLFLLWILFFENIENIACDTMCHECACILMRKAAR